MQAACLWDTEESAGLQSLREQTVAVGWARAVAVAPRPLAEVVARVACANVLTMAVANLAKRAEG